MEMPQKGSGKHPIALVVISANQIAASSEFYTKLFGWKVHRISDDLAGVTTPGGPMAALRANVESGFPAAVPYVRVADIEAEMARVVAAGGKMQRAPWNVDPVGKLALFDDPSGTNYGLTDSVMGGELPHVPMPFGENPKPPAGAICSLEMYAADGAVAAKFFGDLFGWASLATMPQFMAFDAGASVGGVWQSHTPQAPVMVYLYATDVVAKIAEVEAAGGQRVGDPMAMPGMATFGYFVDPSGIAMGLIGS